MPPIIADQGGAHGIVNHGISGLITAARNPVDLHEKIELLLNDRYRREAMAAEAYRVSQRYTWEHVHRILFEGYESVICAHPLRDPIRISAVAKHSPEFPPSGGRPCGFAVRPHRSASGSATK